MLEPDAAGNGNALDGMEQMDDDFGDFEVSQHALFSLSAPTPKRRRGRGRPPKWLAELVSNEQEPPPPEALPPPPPPPPHPNPGLPCGSLDLELEPLVVSAACRSAPTWKGCFMPSSLALHIRKVLAAGIDVGEDADYAKIAECMLGHEHCHVASQSSMSKALDMDRGVLRSKMRRLASSLYWLQRLARMQLEQMIVRLVPSQNLLYYVHSSAYDETPMLCSTVDSSSGFSSTQGAEESGVPVSDIQSWLAQVCKQEGSSVAKILQSHSHYSMLIALTEESLVVFTGKVVSPLQVMGKADGPVLQSCINLHTSVSMHCHRFGMLCRSVVSDQAPCNLKAEALVSTGRGEPWLSLLVSCDTHIVATAHTKTLNDLVESSISGMLRLSLSLRLHINGRLARGYQVGRWATFEDLLWQS